MTEIKVSQRAREAAATLARATYLDDDHPTVQAFARFEQAIRADERAAISIYLESVATKRSDRMKIAAIRAQGDEA